MEENTENQEIKEIKECHCKEHKTEHWIKFALILFVLFIACYLAVYYVLDQMRHAYYMPPMPMNNIDRIIDEQEKMLEGMQGMGAMPMHNAAMMKMKTPVETYKDDSDNTYKMIIDLKPFNNSPNNISLDIQKNKININGLGEKSSKHSDKVYSFSQSFMLPEDIDTAEVTKEQKGHKYIVTMPIEE